MRLAIRFWFLAIGILALPAPACAADQPPYADTLFGDWDGMRSYLSAKGVDLSIAYESESASNLQGGAKLGVRYTDQWAFGTKLDLQKLIGLEHALVQISITDRNGRNLSSDEHLDTLQLVQEVFGRGQTWRITQLWYDQAYFGDALNLKIGRLTVGEDFESFSCEFMNLTFCGAPAGNLEGNYWFNWPVSQWAARVKGLLPGFGYAQIGAYEINPSWLTRRYAFYLGDPPGATGALVPFEVAWLPAFGAAKLAGSYKFGAWYNTSKTADAVENAQGQLLSLAGGAPRLDDGAYGAYINFLQKLTGGSPGNPDQGVSAFFNATFADRRTSTLDNQIALGIFYTGPFASRPADQLGIAVGRTHVNDRVATAEQLQNAAGLGPVGVQHSEYVGEIYYHFHVRGGIDVQPNLQYIHDPGGIRQTDDVVLGLKVSIKL